MRKKGYLLFSMFMTGLFILSACATAQPTTAPAATAQPTTAPAATAQPTTAPAATAQPTTASAATAQPTTQNVTLQYWVFSDYGTGAAGQLQQTFINEFEASHPGVKIIMSAKSDTELLSGETIGAATGTLPDIYMNSTGEAGSELVASNSLANIYNAWMALPDDYRAQINPSMVAELTPAANTMWGIPYTGSSNFLYRNLTVLKKAGIDPNAPLTDWNTWLAQMKQIKATGAYAIGDFSDNYTDFLEVYSGVAGPNDWGIDWANNKTMLNPDLYAQTLKFMIATQPYSVEVGNSEQGATDMFISNELAFQESGPFRNPTFQAAKQSSGLDYDYVLMPGATADNKGGIKGTEFIAFPPNDKNFDIAFKFATYICDEPQMTRWATLLSRYNSNLKTLAKVNDPLLQVTVASANSALEMMPPLFSKAYPTDYLPTIMNNIAAVENSQMTPEQGAQELIPKLNAIIAADK
jgi:multiple sugar transport system substrate-binding protein